MTGRNALRHGAAGRLVIVLVLLCWAPARGRAATAEERIAELERKVDILSREAEQKEMGDIFIPVGESEYGMGPAASKVYFKGEGVSIGGYGEALYQQREGGTDEFDFLRAVFYFGYKFNDKWVFNSELEFEHATTDEEGENSVEFAYLDYLYSDALNFRAGLVLMPVGLINELHEPTVFLSAKRPEVESRIIPSTWRENGAGLFGEVGALSYKTYVVTGFKGEEFDGRGLRGGRQNGSKAVAEDLAWVGRLDWNAAPSLVVGGSLYYGQAGQDLGVDLTTTLWETHVDWRWKGLTFRALGTRATVDDVARWRELKAEREEVDISEVDTVGEEMWGWYVEVGYDVLNPFDTGSHTLTPYVRFEQFDTQSELPAGATKAAGNDVELTTVGLNYKPFEQVVFKGEWQRREDGEGESDNQVNLAMGYVF